MSQLNNNILQSSKYIIGFRVPLEDGSTISNISLSSKEKWTLHIQDGYLYIEFGRKSSTKEYRCSLSAIRRLQDKLPSSTLGVWDLSKREERAQYEHSQDEELRGELIQYVPSLGRYAMEKEFRGDSFPDPETTKSELDSELNEYAQARDYIKQHKNTSIDNKFFQ